MIIITHDESILEAADWAYHMKDGRLEGVKLET